MPATSIMQLQALLALLAIFAMHNLCIAEDAQTDGLEPDYNYQHEFDVYKKLEYTISGPAKTDICSQNFPRLPFNWRASGKVLALTFDDGPQSTGLNNILDVLKSEGVVATFFVNTDSVHGLDMSFTSPANQAALKRVLSEGHELASHAAVHRKLNEQAPAMSRQLVEWAIGNISTLTGSNSVPLFRAPHGAGFVFEESTPWKSASPVLQQLWDVVRQNHVHIGWSFDGADWAVGGADAGCSDRLYNAYGPPLVQNNISGSVLMHTPAHATGGCPKGFQRLISYYKQAGYTFVKVSKLVKEFYGMSPEEVVQTARACGPRQR